MDNSNRAEVEDYAKRTAAALKLEAFKNEIPMPLQHELAAGHASAIRDGLSQAREQYVQEVGSLAQSRRASSLDTQLAHLWNLAFKSYANFFSSTAPESLRELLEESPYDEAEFRAGALDQLKSIVLPRLDEVEDSGDVFFLHITDMICNPPSDKVADAVARGRSTPANSLTLYYALFGLLLQAQRFHRYCRAAEAYSCLLDAQQLLGIAAGSRSITREFFAASKTRHSLVNNMKRHDEGDKRRLRLMDEYYALRKTDSQGKPKDWETAEAAAYVVQDWMIDELGFPGPPDNGPYSFENILKVTRRLFELDAAGSSLDIKGIAVQANPTQDA